MYVKVRPVPKMLAWGEFEEQSLRPSEFQVELGRSRPTGFWANLPVGKKKKPRLFCPFSGLFSGSKLNWTLAFEVSVTDLNLSVFIHFAPISVLQFADRPTGFF